MRNVSLLIVGVLLLFSSGCRSREPQRSSQEADSAAAVPRHHYVIESIDRDGVKKLIQERSGRILFLNIWATWCAPCVEEFPDLIRLSQAYPTSELEVVGISADYPDEADSKILPFVTRMQVPFRIYVATFEHQEDFINSVNPSWNGALPASLIYDANGKQQYFTVGSGTYVKFKRIVDSIKGIR